MNTVIGEEPILPHGALEIETVGMTMRFGGFTALEDVSIRVAPGSFHALLGENGAGKSTLVKCMMGFYHATSGEMLVDRREAKIADPRDAHRMGLGMVYQHFTLVPSLTAAENLVISRHDTPKVIDWGREKKDLDAFMAAMPFRVPLDEPVQRLAAGEKQKLEILKQLYLDQRLLILDEPTSVLTPQEADQLFVTLQTLKAEGRSILYISHKLDEVRRLCDRATILRMGKVVATAVPRDETAASLARLMVGTEVTEVRAAAHTAGADRLVVTGLSLASPDTHGTSLKDIALTVRTGEIVGIAGIAGNGQDEFFAALSGETSSAPGTITLDGRPVGALGITARRRLGAAFVPEERLGHACAPRFTLTENALLSGHATSGFLARGLIDRSAVTAWVDRVVKAFDVRMSGANPEARALSGGNLQKFVVGREILREPALLVVAQPTWGVDAAAASTIRQALVDLAARGAAVLVISQDLDELFALTDRLAVISGGRLSEARPTRELDRETVGLMMGGIHGVAA